MDNLTQSTEFLGDAGRRVHICDRESDIYELFCLAHELGTHFLLRTCVNRRAGDGDHTVAEEMAELAIKKRHLIDVRYKNGAPDQALLEISAAFFRLYLFYPALQRDMSIAKEVGPVSAAFWFRTRDGYACQIIHEIRFVLCPDTFGSCSAMETDRPLRRVIKKAFAYTPAVVFSIPLHPV